VAKDVPSIEGGAGGEWEEEGQPVRFTAYGGIILKNDLLLWCKVSLEQL